MIRNLLPAAAVVAALAFAAPARAESNDTDAITLGALAERADLVVVAEVAGPAAGVVAPDNLRAWSFRATETLRGAAPDGPLTVTLREGRAPDAPGGRFLAFLRRTDAGWTTLELPWALRTTAEPGVAALADYSRSYAACLGPDGRVVRAPELAAHLVASLGATAGGVPFSAGRDLVRHDELHAILTAEQRAAVTAALRAPRRADDDLASIVLAAGACGDAGAADALVARLFEPAMRPLRRHVTASLRRVASPAVVAALVSRLPGADAAGRADAANALGRLDLREAEAPLVRLLGDEDRAVRYEAAHGLGLLARAVRAPRRDGTAAAGGDGDAPRPKLETALAPLLEALPRAAADADRRAVLWAVAQIDAPAAWDALRSLAKEAPDERLRDLASQVLARPRTALLPE